MFTSISKKLLTVSLPFFQEEQISPLKKENNQVPPF